MFGSPIRTTLLISLLFLGGGVLGFRLIGLRPAEANDAQENVVSGESQTEAESAWITLRSAHAFHDATLTLNGVPIPLDRLSNNEAEADLKLSAGSELKLQIKWSADTPETAVSIQITPDGAEAWETTLWAQRELIHEWQWKGKTEGKTNG